MFVKIYVVSSIVLIMLTSKINAFKGALQPLRDKDKYSENIPFSQRIGINQL